MNDRCPHCGKPVSFWLRTVGVLTHTHCPHCDHSLWPSPAKWLIVAGMLLLALYQYQMRPGVVGGWVGVGLLVLLAVIVHRFTTWRKR